jgi:ABC-type multidrug transport system fused ATPase/permease subunit
LLCIARALLQKPKILLMDEATASVDQNTDEKIQNLIEGSFAGTTVLTIAHRLKTIINYDRILVLDQRKLIEEGSPQELIANK